MRLFHSAGVRAAGYRTALLALRGWWVLRRPRSSGVRCVLRDGDAFVLVRHSYGDRRWMLPGGRSRADEDPLATAEREIVQELGVTCTEWRQIGFVAARGSYRRRSRREPFRRHSTVYLEGRVSAPALRPRAGELTHAAWFRADELPADRSDTVDAEVAEGWLPAPAPATPHTT